MKTQERIEKAVSKIDKRLRRYEKHYQKYRELLQITNHTWKGFFAKGITINFHYQRKLIKLKDSHDFWSNIKSALMWVLKDDV